MAIGTVASDPRIQEDPLEGWYGRYIADIVDIQLLSRPIRLEEIRRRFPDWDYWRQPRTHICVPERFAKSFWDFVLEHL